MTDFVHLHNHTHYSVLDATTTIDELVDSAVANEHHAVALTDHGVMFGVIEFYNKCRSKNIKPIIGMEAYVANGSRLDKNLNKNGVKKKNYFHLVLLAKDQIGYKNLIKLTSFGHTDGFYYRPRIDKELLTQYSQGIIALSACLGGVVNSHLVSGDYETAYNEAKFYKELYGDDFYIELQNHGLEHDPIVLRDAPKIAAELGIKLVATNDIHYAKKSQAQSHNVLLSIKDATSTNHPDLTKLRYGTAEYQYKSTKEMEVLFKDFPEAISNTIEIADKCNCEIDLKTYHMPEFDIPKESKATNLDEFLTELVYKGLEERYDNITDEIKARAEYELNVINSMKFPGYFLIVWDFIRAARELGVSVGPGRGSAAGSLVAYSLGITNVDPLPYDLLFERFLNPERVSMPDIDIDFADDKRDKVINYVKEKYGADAVAQIITFGKLSSRAVITDVGRVLGVELSTVKEITAKIPVVRGKVMKFKDALELTDLAWLRNSNDPKIKALIDYCLNLEGRFRATSTHAAGVVIAPGDVTNYVPLYKSDKNDKEQAVEIVTQFQMTELEMAGLLKMDFLGLATLSIIANTLEMIKNNYGLEIDIDKIDFYDTKTYDLLSEGNTLAVFQFESGGMQDYLKKLKPQNLEELTAMNALYRPGPMDNIPDFIDRKHGRKPIEYLHPVMQKALEKTYGIIVYQEQVMLLVQHIADFSLGQADVLRRAMGKKQIKYMDDMKPLFVSGAAKHGISEKLALEIFELIYKFADYGFNKSHSLAYSYLAYQTAWLKAHYPAEFLAANMTSELNNQSKIVLLVEEAKKFGIKVLPPDVNKSGTGFIAHGKEIFFGLAGIKNVGVPAVNNMVQIRQESDFVSFFDFVSRVDTRLINRRTLEALVCTGAFDSLKQANRRALFESIDSALDYSKALEEAKSINMDSLFGGGTHSMPAEPKITEYPEWTEKERLELEKSYLKFYISGHPLDRYEVYVKSLSTLNVLDFNPDSPSTQERICGIIIDVRTRLDKKNQTIAFVMVEDFNGKTELIFWSKSYEKFSHLLIPDTVIICSGKTKAGNDYPNIVADEVYSLDEAIKKYAAGLKVWINLETFEETKIDDFKNNACNQNGSVCRFQFFVNDDSRDYKKNYICFDMPFTMNEDNISKAIEIFGNSNIRLLL